MKTRMWILLFLSTLNTIGQSLEKLKSNTKKIYDANYTMDFEAVTELTYPSIVAQIGKDQFIAQLDANYQNDEFRMRLEIVNPTFSYSNIKKIESHSFCVISYKNPVRYFFENKLDGLSAPRRVALLKQTTLDTDVIFEPKRNSINVKQNSRLIAVYDDTTKFQWTFFNFDDLTQRQLFYTTFNNNVKKELGL